MASLRDRFHHFYALDEDTVKTAIQKGMVVPDTNVLLNLYRFQRAARDELFGALEKVGDNLWIPHQVGLEFHRRRLDVMSEQEGYFKQTLKELGDSVTAVSDKVRAFRSRIALSPENVKEIEDGITRLRDLMGNAVRKAEEFNEVRLDNHASDQVLARIDVLFPDGRVGEPMEPDELKAAREEADRRVKEKIPPGYKDRKKDDPAGDYLIWAQLKVEAAKRQVPVVFITDDTKEDFYEDFKGRKLGARRELREEMMNETGVPVHFMTTGTFLRHAKTYLAADVSAETVDQAKEYAREYEERAKESLDFAKTHKARQEAATAAALALWKLRTAERSETSPVSDRFATHLIQQLHGSELDTDWLTSDDGMRLLDLLASSPRNPAESHQERVRRLAWLLRTVASAPKPKPEPDDEDGPEEGTEG